MEFNFKPLHLENILTRIREEHPNRSGKEIILEKSVLNQVKEKLKQCPNEKLSELAFKFDSIEIKACLELVCSSTDDEINDKASKVLLIRPRNQIILKGWFKLIKKYPHYLLENTLKNLISIKSFKVLLDNKNISPHITEWFMSDKLVRGLIKKYQKKDQHKNFDAYLSENQIENDYGLRKTAWRWFLCICSQKSLKKELPIRVFNEYTDTTNAGYLKQFCQHYLNILPDMKLWDNQIVSLIYNRFGAPFTSKKLIETEATFWNKVSEDAIRQFNKWIMLHHIESFFEGERADFWKIYVTSDHVLQVKEILSGQGFLIDFGKFGVVEFKKVGNAAYVYPNSIFRQFWKRSNVSDGRPEDYKSINETITLSGWNGRIIHHETWEIKTQPIINNLLRM
ncbi:MAG: hypothetical protein ABIJ59_16485 [Pseudomonadota bacterium]